MCRVGRRHDRIPPDIFNKSLEQARRLGAIDSSPSLFDAVKQYGLRLEARKVPIEMIVVTHLEKTLTEN
jgi:uncharacterized protein (TIGR03435 family)